MTNTGIKYAALLFDGQKYPEIDNTPRRVARDVITWRGKLSDHVIDDEVKHWKDWLGTIAWDGLMEDQQIVLAFMPSERPQVFDDESNLLRQRLAVARLAYILASPTSGSDAAFQYVGGEAISIDPEARLGSFGQHGRFPSIPRSFYRTRKAFTRVWPWRDMYTESWVTRMADWVEILDKAHGVVTDDQTQKPRMPVLLDVALDSLDAALQGSRLEFKIPEFVRAADCILATRQGRGKRDFIERSLQLVPELLNHWYVGGSQVELEQQIGRLYDHRSECVHGKVPFLSLSGRGDAGADEAARFEFLAEAIARGVLDFVLRRPAKFSDLRDRDLLDSVWASGSFASA